MKKNVLLLLCTPLYSVFAQNTPFIPQEMDWGTFVPTAQMADTGATSIRNTLSTNDRGLVFAYYTKTNTNSQTESDYFVSSDAYQPAIAGGEEILISKLNSAGQLEWGTYFGGDEDEYGVNIAIDNQDNVYISGATFSTGNIATSGAHKEEFTVYERPPLMMELPDGSLIEISAEMPVSDGFLAKFNVQGNLLWSTYMGGERGSTGGELYVSDTGVFVFGQTLSNQNFTTPGVFQPDWPEEVPNEPSVGYQQPLLHYLAKYSLDGDLLWRTYIYGLGVIRFLDSEGNICFVPSKSQNNYAYMSAENSIVKISTVSGQLLSNVTLPDILENSIVDFQMDASSNHYFYINTEAEGLGTPGSFRPDKITQGTFPNSQEVFLKYDAGMQLEYATYLPFSLYSHNNYPKHIYRAGNEVYVGAFTNEAGLGTDGVFQPSKSGAINAYLMKLNNTGALDWFTYLGSDNAYISTLRVAGDFENEVYICVASLGTENVVNENGLISDPNIFTSLNGGYRTAIMKLIPTKPTSVSDFSKTQWVVYPNPTQDVLHIKSEAAFSSAQTIFAIYDTSGRKIQSGTLQNQLITVSHLQSGLYILELQNEMEKWSGQFVKK